MAGGTKRPSRSSPWLNRTVVGIGLASLLSDWSHEIATTLLPAFLATMGVAAAWLGIIEGVSDGLSSIARMASGYYTDRLARRKPVAVAGYIVTAVGTACFGLATAAWQVLLARSAAWMGRGVRTPVRKALLAAAVTPSSYGRAFGFERMMDTLGAIIGPATAVALLSAMHGDYPRLFAWTLVPGLAAAAMIALVVRESDRRTVPHVSLVGSWRSLPARFKRFLVAVAAFGCGDFAHTMLILLAAQRLAPSLGTLRAAAVATSLYLLHNTLYAGFAFAGGWLADRFPKRPLLAAGYALAALMSIALLTFPAGVGPLLLVFALGGIYVALEETLEDSLCAELVPPAQHGMAFGSLATVNGVGDLVSSVVVGILWSAFGTGPAFAYSASLCLLGASLMLFQRA